MKRLFLLLTITLGCFGVKAQQATTLSAQGGDQEQQIEKLVRSFYHNLEEVIQNKNGNIEPIVKLLDKDFNAVRYIVDVEGRQTRSELTLDGYRKQVSQLSMIKGFRTRYEVEKIDYVKAFETFGLMSYTVQITGSLNDDVVLRFKSIVTTYLRRDSNGEWIIFESSGVNIYQNQEVGICPVSFTKTGKDETQYSATVLSPDGNNFRSEKLDFIFKTVGPKTVITCGKNVYMLEGSQISCVQDNGTASSLKLGKATGSVECINVILAQHLYAGKCLGFKAMDR